MSKLSKALKPFDPLKPSSSIGVNSQISLAFGINGAALGKAPSPYSFYLDILSQWATAPALASMWLVVFNLRSVTALMNNPSFLISDLDSGDFQPWQISQDTIDGLNSTEYQQSTENLMGCVFAQEVNIPGEGIEVIQEGINYSGFLGPNIIKNRSKLSKIKMSFLETNASFADLVIRPWIVLASHYGLVARSPFSEKNVKCDFVDVIQFAKSGPTSSAIIRKIVRYYDVVPVNLNSMSVSRLEEGLKRREVEFIYNGYSVMESGTGLLI